MGNFNNEHIPTKDTKTKVENWSFAGIPQYLQAEMLGIDEKTLVKHYQYELKTGHPYWIGKLAKVAAHKAAEGNEKMLTLLLKTQGHRYGFVEKNITESENSAEVEDLRKRTEQLEKKHQADY